MKIQPTRCHVQCLTQSDNVYTDCFSGSYFEIIYPSTVSHCMFLQLATEGKWICVKDLVPQAHVSTSCIETTQQNQWATFVLQHLPGNKRSSLCRSTHSLRKMISKMEGGMKALLQDLNYVLPHGNQYSKCKGMGLGGQKGRSAELRYPRNMYSSFFPRVSTDFC